MKTSLGFKVSPWIWYVSMLCVVLGMLLAAALKAQLTIKMHSGIPTTRVPGLARAYLDEKEKSKNLQKEIASLHTRSRELEEAIGEGTTGTQLLKDDLQNAKFLAGLTPAEGPGVVVTLRDSKKSPPRDAGPEVREEYIIHDFDIRNFVNELLAAGAEAVAINDQRVITVTAIRCVGGPIRINDVRMAPPYKVMAVGPPDVMESALKMPGGIVDQFRIIDLTDMVHIEKKQRLYILAYMGTVQFKFAKVASAEGEQTQ